MNTKLLLGPAITVFSLCLFGVQAQVLPIEKVILYKNGMGYFQHRGSVTRDQIVEIPLRSNQLDDVLKSLTAIDLGTGRVTEVTYNTAEPIERQLETLFVDPSSSLVDFLRRLKGVEVVVLQSGVEVSGRLLDVDLRVSEGRDGGAPDLIVTLFTAEGDLRTVTIDSRSSIRFQDEGLQSEIERALRILGSVNQKDLRRLRISFEGQGEREVFVAYTAEVPIWKSTYRIVLEGEKPVLFQGWAVVDNTTSMDWDDIQLSLVAGAPISFRQRLSEPVYGSRPEVAAATGVSVRPEIHEGAFETADASAPAQEVPPPRRGMLRARAGEELQDLKMMAGVAAAPSISDELARAPSTVAEGASLADLFEYQIRQPVSLQSRQSALLPILQSQLSAEKVSIYSAASSDRNPRLAVWLENSTSMTLDGGSFTVIDENAFAGEGLMETMQPSERRILSYAVDLGVEIETQTGSEQRQVEKVRVSGGILRFTRSSVEKKTYRMRNKSDRAKSLVVEHPIRTGWSLIEPARWAEKTASYYRFQVPIQPRQTESLVVAEEYPQESVFQLSNLTSDRVAIWLRDRSINSKIERALRPIIDKRNQLNNLQKRLRELERERETIFRDQQRIRENLNRLGRNTQEDRLRQRYVETLEQQENRLAELKQEIDQARAEVAKTERELAEMINSLSLDEEL
jgi:hypothetical protein